MKLSAVKNALKSVENVKFQLPNGTLVPAHFHVTEVGEITKKFIDCGGTLRNEKVANFQLWSSVDIFHRLEPEKLVKIIRLAEKTLQMDDLEIEVEYQSDTIGKYALDFNGKNFLLIAKQTDCLASDFCSVPQKMKVELSNLVSQTSNCCTPGGSCC
jgi:Family of unknown function (DUF6428)